MKEKDKRYRKKLRQYNVTFYLHEQAESDYFASLGVSMKQYLLDKLHEDMSYEEMLYAKMNGLEEEPPKCTWPY